MRELNYIDETIERNENPALRIGSVGRSALSTVYLMDCIEGMKQFPNKIFDLAVVDPPYGIGAENHAGKKENGWTQWVKKDWDKAIPTAEYWQELFRVSKNQIVWGGNYMTEYLPPKMGWIVWDKGQRDFSLADGELAWTSFDKAMRIHTLHRAVANQEDKMHPTQKPVKLYDWIFNKYASEGDLILDTHLGSQSSRIAANKAGLDFVGFEIDGEYFDNGNTRFKNFVSQLVLF
jgi:site-specific DNA-methyltransferase (adenine-specific)